MKPEESETPIYNMVLELENIHLSEITLKIKKKGGTVLDLKTDCIVCEFDKFPVKLDDNNNIDGYYHDELKTVHKYKLEEGNTRVKHVKLQNYRRVENTFMKNIIGID